MESKAFLGQLLLTGKDEKGVEQTFVVLQSTELRRLRPVETLILVGHNAIRSPDLLGLRKDQEVIVAWKVDLSGQQKIATRITALK